MGDFLKENWLWIVIPIVVVLLAVGWVVYMSGEDQSAPFVYDVF